MILDKIRNKLKNRKKQKNDLIKKTDKPTPITPLITGGTPYWTVGSEVYMRQQRLTHKHQLQRGESILIIDPMGDLTREELDEYFKLCLATPEWEDDV